MMRALRMLLVCAAVAALAAPLACAKKHTVTAPAAALPPALVATSPPAGTTAIYDTPIWAQFDRALDPKSIDTTTVFLKVDTRRQHIRVQYEAVTRRVLVFPQSILALQTTYTVEFSPRVKTTSGDSLGTTQYFQFTTNSIRRLKYDYPAAASLEGPFSSMGWSGNGPVVNNMLYDIYAGTDSNAVVQHSGAPLLTTPFLTFAPRNRWPLGSSVYWMILTRNTNTGEALPGAVSRFDIVPDSTPRDTIVIPNADWGGVLVSRGTTQFCTAVNIFTGTGYNCGQRFSLTGLNPKRLLADANIEFALTSTTPNLDPSFGVSLYSAQNPWVSSCSFSAPGPPYSNPDGGLAFAKPSADARTAIFRSDTLSAFLEAQDRRNVGFGYLLRATTPTTLGFQTPLGNVPPKLTFVVFRPAAVAALARQRQQRDDKRP